MLHNVRRQVLQVFPTPAFSTFLLVQCFLVDAVSLLGLNVVIRRQCPKLIKADSFVLAYQAAEHAGTSLLKHSPDSIAVSVE